MVPSALFVQRALLLLRRDELALHQVHLLLERLHRALEGEALGLLEMQRLLARRRRLHLGWPRGVTRLPA